MYASTKKEDGTYSRLNFIKRGLQLCSPKILRKYMNQFLPEYGLLKRIFIAIDYYVCLVIYGAIVCDYFEYEFWKKRSCVRREYVTMKMNKQIKKEFNLEKTGVFRNKMLFNDKFQEFRNLRCFDFSKGSKAEFLLFCQACNQNVIAKPYSGYSGLGIYKPDVSTDERASCVYDELKHRGDFFCEEAFVQTGIMNEVNPTSVNTLRLYTLFDGEKLHITFTMVRFGGGGALVDNIHQGGMYCEIDSKTGYIIGPGYNLSGEKFYYHPISNKFLLGIRVPNWDIVLDYIKRAAMMYPEQGHIAWDVAVSDEKVSIIEGNDGGNFDLPQVGCQRGCKKLYRDFIKKHRQKDRK